MATSEAPAKIEEYLETLGANEGYAEELWKLFQANAEAVPAAWRAIFAPLAQAPANGRPQTPSPAPNPQFPSLLPGDSVEPLRGAAARLAANMEASLSLPSATSQRALPVARLEANRQALNRALAPRGQKLSLTPFLGWALVRAAQEFPSLNSAYTVAEGQAARITRAQINLGLAVDVERAGGRSLLVPVVKNADAMNFAQFARECDRIIGAARSGKISPDDLAGATISLTNPGTIGTRASVPRLMAGQAAIIAAGAVAFPPGFEAVPEATLRVLGVGKSVTLSCTYDHRIVQGAESGAFLARMHALIEGADDFYQRIFRDLEVAAGPVLELPPPPIAALAAGATPAAEADRDSVRTQAAVFQLVHAFRVRGHLQANVDPLRLREITAHPELDPQHYGFTAADLERRFLCPLAGRPPDADETCSLADILQVLRATYCGTLALEFMHLQSPEERAWLQARLESARGARGLDPELQRRTLLKLTQAEEFEHLLHARFVGHKRFSLEGAEALLPGLDHYLNLAAAGGAQQIVLGMSHRGRLNILVNTLGLPMGEMFSKFEDLDPDSVEGSGDVKYHLGAEGSHEGPGGARLAIEMINNPSHLEAVDPVTEGSTRARQDLIGSSGDARGQRVMPLLIHGDAAFAGQGVVAETLNLSQLGGYRTGGTFHFVVNNQIGFTTSPAGARSTLYCTDIARTVQAPIFHVNGDDPEAVVAATALAFAFRQQFRRDVVVDLVCYRRHGHNEADDPSLTSPVLYRNIDQHPSVRVLYAKALESRGVVADAEAERKSVREQLEAQAAAKGALAPEFHERRVAAPETAVAADRLMILGKRLAALPDGFHLHPKLKTFLDRRRQAVAQQGKLDWSLAEALALGSLALEGTPVRLTGQDTGRGTFSQRHAVLYDFETAAPYIPLAHLDPAQQPVEIYDSLLSEEAAMGFEFGYAMTHPAALVLWEAQFGDFANGAQVVIDQFLASSQTKWSRPCGLGLLLPHGFEGQGPEHSSARIERFLELSADDNWRIANCTTSAQYFHLLRSQGMRRPHRPLVVFTPKSLLRHPDVASPFAEFASAKFEPVLGDAAAAAASKPIQRVLLCSGKIYYDLAKARQKRALENNGAATAIIRLEQLYPFPDGALRTALAPFAAAKAWRWVQEEPENMGAWTFIAPRLQALLPASARLEGISRKPSPSPATGSLRRHQQEQAAIIEQALSAPAPAASAPAPS
ncbi:MAG TPA: multifunctional oxoglutarate decarboxylase/oxoglutarate dehydrogenase thiamine pyrophosphate-binding subunit/dihydrolipoyllysine-residue succinyltransferase subunit [Terriglobales bacterium]|nr:multifunctional oxoglutarate decarboxylase/oxoglutarate dehydrogenase thiamine pyrophosphate-binding subunit/dihydrolipoyllysine-residue succinyltransferase subunit [Terriglobales bacterium]